MKKILNIKFSFLLAAMVVFLFSCETEDYTGYSTIVPTNPTITISNNYTSINMIEKDSIFTFDVTLSVAQIVDVYVYIKQIDGDATEGSDFVILNDAGRLTIPFGSTTGKLMVKVLSDDIFEGAESFTLQLGDERTANASVTPITVLFTIANTFEDEIEFSLTWNSDAIGLDGELIDPLDLADMVFVLTDMDLNPLVEIDGAGFEAFSLLPAAPDGDYYLATYFYAAMDLGDQGSANLNLTLDYYQAGVQAGSFEHLEALNTVANFNHTFYLAKLTKTGNTWTISKFEGFPVPTPATWDGLDGLVRKANPQIRLYPNTVSVEGTTNNYTIDGLNTGWMYNAWGETVTSTIPVDITFNVNGTLVIPSQAYMVTDYGGDPYNYDISGEGTWSSMVSPAFLTVKYEMTYEDGSLALAHYYFISYTTYANDYFLADLVPTVVKNSTINRDIKGSFNSLY